MDYMHVLHTHTSCTHMLEIMHEVIYKHTETHTYIHACTHKYTRTYKNITSALLRSFKRQVDAWNRPCLLSRGRKRTQATHSPKNRYLTRAVLFFMYHSLMIDACSRTFAHTDERQQKFVSHASYLMHKTPKHPNAA
jgi:hypothetical protein